MINSTFSWKVFGRSTPDFKYCLEDCKILILKVIFQLSKIGRIFLIFFSLKICPKLNAKFIIGLWFAKDYNLKLESAIYHSINLGFDAEVAEKFLNGI